MVEMESHTFLDDVADFIKNQKACTTLHDGVYDIGHEQIELIYPHLINTLTTTQNERNNKKIKRLLITCIEIGIAKCIGLQHFKQDTYFKDLTKAKQILRWHILAPNTSNGKNRVLPPCYSIDMTQLNRDFSTRGPYRALLRNEQNDLLGIYSHPICLNKRGYTFMRESEIEKILR